jgi:flagellar hook-associated protein 2
MISDLFLVSALTKNSSAFGGGASSLFAPLAAIAASKTGLAQAQLNQSLEDNTAKAEGYDALLGAVKGFQTALTAFDTADDINTSVTSSSNSTVASATAGAGAGIGVYDLAVTELARAQTAVSGAFADSDTTIVGSGTLTFQLGEYESGTNSFTPGASGPVAINITNGTLDDIADAINSSGAGVTASIVQSGSDSYLSLTSAGTGATNGFSLTVTDLDGNDTDTSGLSQIAFDPTATAGAGKNLTETVAAQDAAFTVNGIAATSAANSGITISPDLTVNLLQPGSTTVTVAKEVAALTGAAEDFVDAFNALSGAIGELTGSNGALKGDALAARLAAALKAPLSEDFGASGALDLLYEIGITPQADGSLAVDEAKLQSAFAGDPSGAVALLNKAATDFDAIVDPFAKGGGTIEGSAKAFSDNALYLESLLPALQQMGDLNQQYAAAQTANALLQLYSASLTEGVFDNFPAKAFSQFA